MRDPRRARLAVAGAVTGGSGLAVSLGVTGVLNERANPVVVVAEAIIEVTPGRLAEALIQAVGQYDKPLLVAGVVVGLLALSVAAGLLAGRDLLLGGAVFVAMGGIAAVAAVTRPGATSTAVVPVVVGMLTWLVALPLLVRAAAVRGDAAAPGGGAEVSRRGFLLATGGVAVGAAAFGLAGRLLGRSRGLVESARERLRLPVSGGTPPAGAGVAVPGTPPWQTPNDVFYRIDTALVLPTVVPEEWSLRLHGMVRRPLTLSYADLLDRGLEEAWVTLCCVSNEVGGELIGNAWWSGVRVADLLAEAGPLEDADAVLQTSEDGWTCGTPLAALTDDRNALLAVAMNGRPLPVEHGFPVRMVVPGLYGYVSATKWLVDLEVTRFDRFDAYWTERGWAERGPIKTQSRIDVPGDNHRVSAGDLVVAGTAWAQHTGIEAVEVRLDDGPWQAVDLGSVPNVDTWVQWSGTVRADVGVHTLQVRATDRSGRTQTEERSPVVPDGATGWHTIELTAE